MAEKIFDGFGQLRLWTPAEFTGHAPLPHEIHDLLKESTFAQVRGEINFTEKDFSDDEFFSEYPKNCRRVERRRGS